MIERQQIILDMMFCRQNIDEYVLGMYFWYTTISYVPRVDATLLVNLTWSTIIFNEGD